MDMISGDDLVNLANDDPALSKTRPSKKDLRPKLAKLKLCK
jgi:hypothetical protein